MDPLVLVKTPRLPQRLPKLLTPEEIASLCKVHGAQEVELMAGSSAGCATVTVQSRDLWCHMPENPPSAEVDAARDLILEALLDFPFDCDGSKASIVAAPLTAVLRSPIDGLVPLVIVDKPQADTGASLLARVSDVVATGSEPSMMAAPVKSQAPRGCMCHGAQHELDWH